MRLVFTVGGKALPSHLMASDYPDVDSLRLAWAAHETKCAGVRGGPGLDGIEQVFQYQLLNGAAASSRFRRNMGSTS